MELLLYRYLDLRFILRSLPQFFLGLELTVEVSLVAMAMALAWGLVLAAPRMSGRRWLAAPAVAYIEVMRNTPLLLQIYLVYFGLPLIGLGLSPFASGAVAIAGQHGAFLAEVYRGGIESVSVKQWEGARALGMTRWRALRLVVLPQALLRVVPPVGNQLVILVKDSSLVSAIGIMELTLTGKALIERSGASYEVFVTIALFDLALTSSLSAVLRLIERRYRARL
jgi:polar amino acid transport system permease protein